VCRKQDSCKEDEGRCTVRNMEFGYAQCGKVEGRRETR
jgi:hypothetical protein